MPNRRGSADIYIEGFCDIGPRVTIFSGANSVDIEGRRSAGPGRTEPIRICKGAWLGAGTTVLAKVTTGASIGSLRQALRHCEAELGDYLYVKATKPQITFESLNKESLQIAESGAIRLSLLRGCDCPADDSEAITKIAVVLGISASSDDEIRIDARRRLQARGESELAELISSPDLSVDDYISNMGKLLDR